MKRALCTLLICITLSSTVLLTGCSSTRMVVVIKPQKTKSRWKNQIRVFIRFSSKSHLENRLAVINASKTRVSVYPVDVTLEIPEAKLTLPAVLNFNDYVKKRQKAAAGQCLKSTRPKRCSRYIDRFFRHYRNVNIFRFGEIPSRKKQTGYFAFNLPDPLNESAQSKRAQKLLRNKGRVIKGIIRVTVHTAAIEPQQQEFIFPVRVIISRDEKTKLLKIMKYF